MSKQSAANAKTDQTATFPMIRLSRRILALFVFGLSLILASGVILYRAGEQVRLAAKDAAVGDALAEELGLFLDAARESENAQSGRLSGAETKVEDADEQKTIATMRLHADRIRMLSGDDTSAISGLLDLQRNIDPKDTSPRESHRKDTLPTSQENRDGLLRGLNQLRERETHSAALSRKRLETTVLESNRSLFKLIALQAVVLIVLLYIVYRDAAYRGRSAFEVLRVNLRLSAILTTMGEGLYQVDRKGNLVYINPAGEKLLGYKSEQILGQPMHDLVHPADKQVNGCTMATCALLKAAAGGEPNHNAIDEFVRSDGVLVPVEYTSSSLLQFGDRHGMVLIFSDISERTRMELALRDSEERYRNLVEKSRGLICTHTMEGTLISVNEASAQALGYSVDELESTNIRDLLAPRYRSKLDWYLKAISEWGAHSGFMRVVTRDGNELVWAYSNRVIHEAGRTPYVLGNAHDVTAQIQVEEALKLNEDKLETALQAEKRKSRFDYLTNIPNRRTFYEAVEAEAQRAQRYGRPTTVAYLDIDNFKAVNDQFGHAEGDEVLKRVAGTIHSNIRRTDMAARLGGDEFAILLPETDARASEVVVSKIRDCLEQEIAQRTWPISFSIGVVTFEKPLESAVAMINKADELMYDVKRQGKNSILSVNA